MTGAGAPLRARSTSDHEMILPAVPDAGYSPGGSFAEYFWLVRWFLWKFSAPNFPRGSRQVPRGATPAKRFAVSCVSVTAKQST